MTAAAMIVDGTYGVEFAGQRVLPVGVAEKASVAFRISLEGKGGHASLPGRDHPLERLTAGLQRLVAASPNRSLSPEVVEMLGRLGARSSGLQGWLMQRISWAPVRWVAMPTLQKQAYTNAMTRNTVAWTGLTAGDSYNVIPNRAEAQVDMRILPGTTPEEALAWAKEAIDLPEASYEILEFKSPSRSALDSPWFNLYEAVAAQRFPDMLVAPILSPASTDARHTRPAGIPSYVVVPAYEGSELLATIHEKDERIPARALGEGARFFFEFLVASDAAATPHER